MKNRRLIALMMGTIILATTVFAPAMTINADEENDKTQEEEPLTKAEILKGIEDGTFVTGTQQNYIDNEIDADADIEEEVALLIPEDREVVKITSAEDLVKLAKDCRLDTWSANKDVILVDDISLASSEFVTIPSFSGTFDGQGHTISGYLVSDSASNVGLFSRIEEDGIVKNLKVRGTLAPKGKSNIIGGIAARNYGTIVNCSFDGQIRASDYAGGIAGINGLSGIISDSATSGYILAEHFTGGIAGENMGNILRCNNLARVNTNEQEVTFSVEDISVDMTLSILGFGKQEEESESESMVNGVVDTGGIAGLSVGVIQNCTNNGVIGYEKLGYNVGGIAGRQSGYMVSCTNNGIVKGRKDVGGIVGQAEPYATVDFAQDTVRQLSDNIEKLHDIISVTLNDADGQSDAISNRLSIIQNFTDMALDDTSYLADRTVTYVDGIADSANKAINKVDYIIGEVSRDGGVFDQANYAFEDVQIAAEILDKAIKDIDIYQYLSADEKAKLDADRAQLELDAEALKKLAKDYKDNNASGGNKTDGVTYEAAYNALKNYYLDMTRDDYVTNKTGVEKDGAANLRPIISGAVALDWSFDKSIAETDYQKIYDKYKNVTGWVHTDANSNGTTPYSGATGSTDPSEYCAFPAAAGTYSSTDEALKTAYIAKAGENIGKNATAMAEALSKNVDTSDATSTVMNAIGNTAEIADILLDASDVMKTKEGYYADASFNYIKEMGERLKNSSSSIKSILNNASNMPKVSVPELGEEYRAHTTSLNNNLKGMSDNFGYLNTEMNHASDTLISDLSAVNDQFNVIMLLYTDAIDGVLDRDYSNIIEDDSTAVAETCVDATIDSCVNKGNVEGSINIAGIVGTMGVEYDYDLESDVTGIKESNMNTTYLTKCVLRANENRAKVTAGKNYAGGVCGLQEMGTIIRCGNYARVESTSGGYVGGIAGGSYSDIIQSYEKSILSGSSYVGGIAGDGADISKCVSVPNIEDADQFYGAIAGHVSNDAIIRDNYFYNDELAGIDRVSYSKKAEPLSYAELLNIEGIPNDFSLLTITYILEDEDNDSDVILDVQSAKYASLLTSDMFPTVPTKEGFYHVWDKDGADSVVTDMEIIASYERLYTTLASDTMLSNGQSAVLVDGQFEADKVFTATKNYLPSDKMHDCIEYWELSIPDDGANIHQVRYLVGDEYREDIGDDFEVYVYSGSAWERVDLDKMGAYSTFDVPGNDARFQVINIHKELPKYVYYCIAAAVIIIVIILITVIVVRKRHKRIRQKYNLEEK